MTFVGHVDEAGEFCLHGWAHSNTLPDLTLHVDILVNGRIVRTVRAGGFREDLRLAGVGDGRKAFSFNPYEYLSGRENILEVFVAGTDNLLVNGRRSVRLETSLATGSKSKATSRWEGDEVSSSLTWGSIITGDTFVDAIERQFVVSSATQILEVGPGYGRLLKTLLDRNLPFGRFLGIDLSAARTDKLRRRFGSANIDFAAGDCSSFKPDAAVDLIISSATFEHLFPSMQQSLANLHAVMQPGAMIMVDFISDDESLSISRAYFEDDAAGGAFIRVYSRDELQSFFASAGFEHVDIVHPFVLGHDVRGHAIRRALVTAVRR